MIFPFLVTKYCGVFVQPRTLQRVAGTIGIPTKRIAPNHLFHAAIQTPESSETFIAPDLATTTRVTAYDIVAVARVINYWYHSIRRVYHEDFPFFYRCGGVELSAFQRVMALREMRMNPAFLRDGRCAANGWSDCHFCCVGEEVLQGQLVFFDNWGLLTTKISFFKLGHGGLFRSQIMGSVYFIEPIGIVHGLEFRQICWDLETHGTCHFSPILDRLKLKPLDGACCVYGVIVAIVHRP